jgi:phosphoribosylamine--glycine ligase
MKILLIGNRAIQHALELKLRYEGVEVYVYPGQQFGGYTCIGKEEAIRSYYDLIIIGSPRYIDDEVVTVQRDRGAKIFGADQKSVELESSKHAFKNFAEAHGIPTSRSQAFVDCAAALKYLERSSPPFVIKSNGPARGCGVSILHSIVEAEADINRKLCDRANLYYSGKVVIEDYVPGFEVALNILISPSGYLILPPTRPHKRLNNGDEGPLVAGMGSFAGVALNQLFYDELHSTVLEPAFRGMRNEGRLFSGCLFVNLMIGEAGVMVLEFNCRMGDPAMLTSLMLLRSSVSDLLLSTVEDGLARVSVALHQGVALAVTLVDPDYPDGSVAKKRVRISERDLPTGSDNAWLTIAGAERDEFDPASLAVTNGVVACAVSRGKDCVAARAGAYAIAEHFPDLYCRTDIGTKVMPPKRYRHSSHDVPAGLCSFREI